MLLAREGAKVAVADIRVQAAEATAESINRSAGAVIAIQADVTKAEDVNRMVKTTVKVFGKLDVLVNNAGTGTTGDVVELPEADWQRVMDVNLKGIFLGCKYAIPEMINSKGGSIINIASMWAFVGGSVSCVYPASKAGILALSKNTALKYAPLNIRVNCICPGHVETPLSTNLKDPEFKNTVLKKYPLGRLGTPLDVAYAVLFLASDESSFITGTEIIVDGGYMAQ
jgi:NAD(P)-dependent dehydrogenase (short-subunit alcohol dehydrogenase family)